MDRDAVGRELHRVVRNTVEGLGLPRRKESDLVAVLVPRLLDKFDELELGLKVEYWDRLLTRTKEKDISKTAETP